MRYTPLDTYPYCRYRFVSQLTAMLLHTSHPADNEKNTRMGIVIAKAIRGTICGAYGRNKL